MSDTPTSPQRLNQNDANHKALRLFVFISLVFIGLFVAIIAYVVNVDQSDAVGWTPEEIAIVSSLRLPDGGLTISDTSNRWLNSDEAISLGRRLFFDKNFSLNKQVACSTCHKPEQFFTDGEALSLGVGGLTKKHTPSLVGSAAFRWQFWNGRVDSLWAQALEPLEQPREHGLDRLTIVRRFLQDYGADYSAIFGDHTHLADLEHLPQQASPVVEEPSVKQAWATLSQADQERVNRIFSNIGKSLAAYQATLVPEESRFDKFARQLEQAARQPEIAEKHTSLGVQNGGEPLQASSAWLSPDEQAGLKLFIDDAKGQCVRCHNGPLFTNGSFQATSVPPVENGRLVPTQALQLKKKTNEKLSGRAKGINVALSNEFNCLSIYSDAKLNDCAELQFAKRTGIELQRAFKVPTLRNIAHTAPYMHKGQFDNLSDLLKYYNDAPLNGFSHTELEPLGLLPHELHQLEAFLISLSDSSLQKGNSG